MTNEAQWQKLESAYNSTLPQTANARCDCRSARSLAEDCTFSAFSSFFLFLTNDKPQTQWVVKVKTSVILITVLILITSPILQDGYFSLRWWWQLDSCSQWFSSWVDLLLCIGCQIRITYFFLFADHHVFRPWMRLHQPDRPLQQVKHRMFVSVAPPIS